jgi:hypothetical protein
MTKLRWAVFLLVVGLVGLLFLYFAPDEIASVITSLSGVL